MYTFVYNVVIDQDHYEVCQSLRNLSRQDLIVLGGALGLTYPNLEKMYLAEMVAAWLNQQDNVLKHSGEPTWGGLADVLEEIGHIGTAEDIRKTKCHNNKNGGQQQDFEAAAISIASDSSKGMCTFMASDNSNEQSKL